MAAAPERCVVEWVRRGWFRRTIRLSGVVEATVDYDGRGLGYETLRVNGRIVCREFYTGSLLLCPEFQFVLPSRYGDVPASLEVRANGWLDVGEFRLTVAGEAVYTEGAKEGGALPIPAVRPSACAGQLPRASSSSECRGENLPVVGSTQGVEQ